MVGLWSMMINDQDPRQCVATTRDRSRPLRHSFPNGEAFQCDEDRWALFHPEKSGDVQRCAERCSLCAKMYQAKCSAKWLELTRIESSRMIFAFSSSVWRHWRRSHTRSLLVCLSLVFHVYGLSQSMPTITSTCSCALVTSVTFVTLAICCCRASVESVLQSLKLLSIFVHNGMPVDDF